MKKTLAAVLAAAMALSTATVAMAKDTLVDENLGTGSTTDVDEGIDYGKNTDRLINELGDFDGTELAEQVDAGNITVTAIVTEGSNRLDGKPSITLFKRKDTVEQVVTTTSNIWTQDVYDKDGTTKLISAGDTVTYIPLYQVKDSAEGTPHWLLSDSVNDTHILLSNREDVKNGSVYNTALTELKGVGVIETKSTVTNGANAGDKVLRLRFKVADTYGTGSTTIGMKLRITVRKNFTANNGTSYSKGNTYTTDEFKFKAEYKEIAENNDYSRDMQVTLEEVDRREVKFDASDLYDEIGSDEFTLSFEDTAVFTAKLSASQKDVNLYYDLDEKTEVTDAYPNVDFEFITFRGKPSFVNSGTMTFNAVGGRNTQVYTFDGETLAPLTTTYDSTYGTVSVKGVKTLGTFVVASEVLEVEDDEDNEPVSSAPVVEEPSSSQPSTSDERNPSTGAC